MSRPGPRRRRSEPIRRSAPARPRARSRVRRVAAAPLALLLAVGLLPLLGGPAYAAHSSESHADSQFIHGSLLPLDLSSVVGIDGASADYLDGHTAGDQVAENAALDVTALSLLALNLPDLEVQVGDLLDLGVVNQEATAQPDGDSAADTGAASVSLDLMALLPPNPALSTATLALGAVASHADIDGETGELTRTTTIADASLAIQSPLVATTSEEVTTLVSSLNAQLNGLSNVLEAAVNNGILDIIASVPAASGAVSSETTVTVTSRLNAAVAGLLAAPLSTDLVTLDPSTGQITVNVAGGIDLNDVPPNSTLLSPEILQQVSADVATLLGQLQEDLNDVLANALDYVDVTITSSTEVTVPVVGTFVAGLELGYEGTLQDLIDGSTPIELAGTGALALLPLGPARVLVQDAVGAAVGTAVGTVLTTTGEAVDDAVTSLTDALDPALDLLAGVARVDLNVQHEADGLSSRANVTAVQVQVLSGAGAELNLATSSVGPNVYAPLAPTLDAVDDPVSGGSDAPVTGAGWHPEEQVTLELLAPDGTPVTGPGGDPVTVTVTTDADGAFSTDVPVPTGVPAGDYTVRATNTGGDTASDTLTVIAPTLDAQDAPVPPGGDAQVSSSGWGPDTAVSVQLVDGDGNPVGDPVEVTTDADGAFPAGTTVPVPAGTADGSYTVLATDPYGNTASDTVVVDGTAPEVTILDPVDGAVTNDSTPTVSGTVDDETASVDVVVRDSDGDVVFEGPATVEPDGSWSVDTSELPDGDYTVTATATDPAGNTGTDGPVGFTVDTTAPDVEITDPVDGDVTNDSTPTITGVVDDVTATVDVVVSNSDGDIVFAGTAEVAPNGTWSIDSSELPDGDYTVTATATDAAGNVDVDGPVGFTVDTTAPVVEITSPADGAVLDDATPTIDGTVDDPEAIVEVTITDPASGDVVAQGPATVAPDGTWTFTPDTPLPDGDYTVGAVATDPAGNTDTDAVDITVDTTAPVVEIASPADGDVTADATPTIEGTVDDPTATVEVVVRDSNGDVVAQGLATVAPDGTWTFTPDTPLPDGDYTVEAVATDPAGNEGEADPVDFTIDTTAPSAPVITAPSDGELTNDDTPAIQGTGEPGATVDVTITHPDGSTTTIEDVPVDEGGNWSTTPPSPLPDGENTIEATQTDEAGNTSEPSAPVTVVVDTTAPVVEITSPTDGDLVSDDTPTITGTVDDPTATVEVVVRDGNGDVVFQGQPTVEPDGSWSIDTSEMPDGDYTVEATATDAAGNTGTDTIDITIDATVPEPPVITAPSDGELTNDSTPTIEGTGEPGATVEVVVDGEKIGEATVDEDGNWSLPVEEPLSAGEHTVEAIQTDPAGNTSDPSSVTFTVRAVVEPPVITSPADGDEVDLTPTVTGTGLPGATVTVYVDGEAVGTTTVGADGTWSLTLDQPLDCGEHDITATQTVDDGRATERASSAQSAPVTVQVSCPGGSSDSGSDGGSDGGSAGTAGGPAATGGLLPDTGSPLGIATLVALLALATGLVASGGVLLRRRG